MEVNDANIQALTQYLEQTLSPDAAVRKPAEKFLQSVEGQKNFPQLLMQAMSLPQVAPHIRVAAALNLKNVVRRQWAAEESKLCEDDRVAIKQRIVPLMLTVPESEQRQLSEAIAIIGRHDFPDKWPNLLPDMVAKFTTPDFHAINGVLRTANPLFARYRYEERSDSLWMEIKYVLETMADPLTHLMHATMDLAQKHGDKPDDLKVLLNSVELICEVFYSLNYQDLPEYYEDHMKEWMGFFQALLPIPDNPAIAEDDEDQPSVIVRIKTTICRSLSLYARKYDEEFEPYLQSFVELVWQLLTQTDLEVRNDILVSTAMSFLTTVSEQQQSHQLFGSPEVLSSICEKVIIPNMSFREVDEEVFEDDAEEYMRRDFEGSDIDTRRRAAFDFVRGLCKFWEGPVTQVFFGYVTSLLQEYAADPQKKWKSKDLAVFIVTSLASRSSTTAHGTTQTNENINVLDFFKSTILPDLQSDVNAVPVLKADAIKYIVTFRSQLPKEVLTASIPFLIEHLSAKSAVVASYAAACLERLMFLRIQGKPVIVKEDLSPVLEKLLVNLFGALERPNMQENEYVMKAIMRVIATAKESLQHVVGTITEKLSHILVAVSKNPSRPRFNHFLFESLGCAIRYTCAANISAVEGFERALFPPFELMLQNDVVEFQPYVFQLLSQLLETRPPPVPGPYMALFPFLLQPVLWESSANTTPLVRLLRAFVFKGGEAMLADNAQLQGLLGIFQKLIASRAHDHEGFNLLSAIVEVLPANRMDQYMQTIYTLLLTRMQHSRTAKFTRGFLAFICLLVGKYGGTAVVNGFDAIQPNLFQMVLNRLLEDVQKVSGDTDRKTCAVGMVKLLAETPEMLTKYSALWPMLLTAVVKLLELPEEEAADEFIDVEPEQSGYKASFNRLAFAGTPEHDPFPDVQKPKLYLAKQLHTLAAAHPGQLGPMIAQNDDVNQAVQTYLQMAQVGPLP